MYCNTKTALAQLVSLKKDSQINIVPTSFFMFSYGEFPNMFIHTCHPQWDSEIRSTPEARVCTVRVTIGSRSPSPGANTMGSPRTHNSCFPGSLVICPECIYHPPNFTHRVKLLRAKNDGEIMASFPTFGI